MKPRVADAGLPEKIAKEVFDVKKILVPRTLKASRVNAHHVESVVKGCSVPDFILLRVVEPVHFPVGTVSVGGVF
jgi:hypothetical protein